MKYFEIIKETVLAGLFAVILGKVFIEIAIKFNNFHEMKVVYALCCFSLVLLLFKNKIKDRKKIIVSVLSVYALIILKVFCWDYLPGRIEGAFKSKDFGCMCAEGIYLFQDGNVKRYNLAHKTKDTVGTYFEKNGRFYVTTKNDYEFEVLPRKEVMLLAGQEATAGTNDYLKGYRFNLSENELKEYEGFQTEEDAQKEMDAQIEEQKKSIEQEDQL